MMIRLSAEQFDFESAVCSHGWYQLAPFSWDPARRELGRVERLNSGEVVRIRLGVWPGRSEIPAAAEARTRVWAAVEVGRPLRAAELDELLGKVRWMLRLDEEYAEFQRLCAGVAGLDHVAARRRGRILRSSTVFEDAVKTVCATNTTWARVKAGIGRLVASLGDPLPSDPRQRCFPTAERVFAAGAEFLREEVRLGYRASCVAALAAASGELEELKGWSGGAAALRRRLLSLQGIGPYAAAHLMVLLGVYDSVPLGVPAGEAATAFDNWGRWKALAFWFCDWEATGSG